MMATIADVDQLRERIKYLEQEILKLREDLNRTLSALEQLARTIIGK